MSPSNDAPTGEMKDLVERALDLAQRKGAQYADVRVQRQESQSIAVKNGTVEQVALGEDAGFGVRVLVDGAWGFASSYRMSAREVEEVTDQAVRIAKATAPVHQR